MQAGRRSLANHPLTGGDWELHCRVGEPRVGSESTRRLLSAAVVPWSEGDMEE